MVAHMGVWGLRVFTTQNPGVRKWFLVLCYTAFGRTVVARGHVVRGKLWLARTQLRPEILFFRWGTGTQAPRYSVSKTRGICSAPSDISDWCEESTKDNVHGWRHGNLMDGGEESDRGVLYMSDGTP